MDVEGVLQLLAERLHLGALLEHLPAEPMHLPLQRLRPCRTLAQHSCLTHQIRQLQPQGPQLRHSLPARHIKQVGSVIPVAKLTEV